MMIALHIKNVLLLKSERSVMEIKDERKADFRDLTRKVLIILTKGFPDQKFLGAIYIPIFFKVLPKKYHRNLALNLIAISPHYFLGNFKLSVHKQSYQDFLESENEKMISTRKCMMNSKIKPYLNPSTVALDHGCGPGYLANAVAPYCRKVFAVDISDGVIACAKAINGQPNIEYITEKNGEKLSCIRDFSIDVVYSTAVMLHVTDEVCKKLLREFFRVLKTEGKVICEFVVNTKIKNVENNRINEADKKKQFLLSKMKDEYSLRVVERSRNYIEDIIIDTGFRIDEINVGDESTTESGYFTFVFSKI